MKNKYLSAVLLLAFGMAFTACSNNDEYEDPQKKEVEEINTMEAYTPLSKKENGKQNICGFGYDLTGDYLSSRSVRKQVVDIDAFKAKNSKRFYISKSSWGYNYTIAGGTDQYYIQSLNSSFNKSNLYKDVPLFTGTIIDNDILNSNGDLTDEYAFASAHYLFVKKTYKLNADEELLYPYLTNDFLTDVANLKTGEVIEKYGTHILTSYSVGGRLDMVYRSKIKQDETILYNPYSKKKYPETGLRYVINQMSYHVNGSIEPINENDVKQNQVPILYVYNHGGNDELVASGTYNLQKKSPEVDINNWFKTVTDDNASLVTMELKDLIPIYDFVSDTEKKAELKLAVEQYILSRQIK